MLQQMNEQVWPALGNRQEDFPAGSFITGGNSYQYFEDFLAKVRICIMNPHNSVVFTDIDELNFIKRLLTDYKNSSAGNYIFTGPWGDNVRIGQFPTATGSANSYIRGQGSFPEESFLQGSNIFNDILHKLGDVIYPPVTPVYGSPGEV